MERYFDAFLYLANWGTRRLMIRLPARLLDLETAERYCVGDAATAWVGNDHLILDLCSEDESGDWEDGGEGWLASIIPARAELGGGDLRVLYLAWLLCAQASELADDVVEPPVPPGLGSLTAPLRSLADFLRIDEDLIVVAGMASDQPRDDGSSAEELAEWIEALPLADRNALILRIVQGDDPHLRLELPRRFRGRHGATGEVDTGNRTVAELLDAAAARRTERDRIAARRQEQERAYRERQAAIARDQRLESLALQKEQAWQRVSMLIDTKKPREYDDAVTLLKDLRAMGERKGLSAAFEERYWQLRSQHLRKPSLLERLNRAGL
ncbi:MAG: hypothetical protein ACRD0K_09545 [Egibacteraceae bacterium]